jgi:maleamate amidohydrolase
LVVDGINAFYAPAGSMYYAAVERTVPAIVSLLGRARANGRLVVHCVERHLAGLEDFEWAKLPPHCAAGEFDSEVYEAFAPGGNSAHELELAKRRFSAFFGTDLALLLREQAVEIVVVAGVKTNVCVRATVEDAFAWGFSPVVVRDATNSNRAHLAEASLEDIERYMGRVVGLEEALELL